MSEPMVYSAKLEQLLPQGQQLGYNWTSDQLKM